MDCTEFVDNSVFNKSAEGLLCPYTDIWFSNQTNETASGQLCGHWLTSFGAWYGRVHGIIALLVCFFGCVLNFLSLIVLTRRVMHNSTNTILSGLAFADLLNDLEYLPFTLFMKTLAGPNFPPKTYPWALFVLAHSNFSKVCHTSSIWLTVTLAVWRYLIVAMPTRNRTICTIERAKLAVSLAYFCSLLVCIPDYLTFSIKDTAKWAKMNNITVIKHYVHYSDLAQANDQFLVKANFWTYSVVIKLLPCIVLTIVSFCLITSLIETERRKAQLLGQNRESSQRGGAGCGMEGVCGGDKTTKMLMAVLLFFLMTEFPQGILGLLSAILGDTFFRNCYLPLGDFMDIIALANSAINFILYISMSLKFRQVFAETFGLQRICAQWLVIAPSVPAVEALEVLTIDNAASAPSGCVIER